VNNGTIAAVAPGVPEIILEATYWTGCMNGTIIRHLSFAHPSSYLAAPTDALLRGDHPKVQVDGANMDERLAHANLALRIRKRMDQGIDAKTAFRTVLSDVREFLTHD